MGGLVIVSCTLPFGWKESAFVYQTLGAAVASFFRDEGIPCSIYIDDRLIGELMMSSGPLFVPVNQRSPNFGEKAAQAAIFLVCFMLVGLGYVLNLTNCCLIPVTALKFLGFFVDSGMQSFKIPAEKLKKFADLRESILRLTKKVSVKTLQRFQGKCVSFSLAVPAAKLFIRNICGAVASAHGALEVSISSSLREKITHWRFLDAWTGHMSWRSAIHTQISLESDASGFGWGV